MLSCAERVDLKYVITDCVMSLCRDQLGPRIPGIFHVDGFISVSLVSDSTDANHMIVVSIKEKIDGSKRDRAQVPAGSRGDHEDHLSKTPNTTGGEADNLNQTVEFEYANEPENTGANGGILDVTPTVADCVSDEHGTHILEFEYTNKPETSDNIIKLEDDNVSDTVKIVNSDFTSRAENTPNEIHADDQPRIAACVVNSVSVGDAGDNTGKLDHNDNVTMKKADAEKHTMVTSDCEVKLDARLVDNYLSRHNSGRGADLSDNKENNNSKRANFKKRNSDEEKSQEAPKDAFGAKTASLQESVISSGDEQNSVITEGSSMDSNKTCRHCGKYFKYKQCLVKHMKSDKRNMCTNKCGECGKCFHDNVELKIHLRTHTGERPYGCEECGKRFVQSAVLKMHSRMHSGYKPFSCEDCGKRFTQKANLEDHIRRHVGDRPHKCTHCAKGFYSRYHLNEHLEVHSGKQPFVCIECDKCFYNRTQLRLHMRVHIWDKPCQCAECGKCFSVSSHLTRHMRVHTGDKPYPCTECGKRFSQKGNLRKHLRKHIST